MSVKRKGEKSLLSKQEIATRRKALTQKKIQRQGGTGRRAIAAVFVFAFSVLFLRGKSAKYEAFYPDGSAEVLLEVPNYDFSWQTTYLYKNFKEVPAGTVVVFTSKFDNSAANLAQRLRDIGGDHVDPGDV